MAKVDNFDLYRIPSNRILQYRREFYGLRRSTAETSRTWFHRLRICIDRCEFPKFVEYLLMDKFICELEINEMDFYRMTDHWTVELLNCVNDQEIPTGQMNAVFSIERVKTLPPDEDEKECILYIPSNETPSGGSSNHEEDDDVSSVASIQSDIENKSLLRLENSDLGQMMPNDVMECETGEYQYSAYEPATGTFIKLESPVESTTSAAILNEDFELLNAEQTSNYEKRLETNQKQPVEAIPNNDEHYQIQRSSDRLRKVSIKKKIARNQDSNNEDIDCKSSIANKQKRNSTICNESEKCFKKPSHLKIHKRTHTGKKSFDCDQCNNSYTHRAYLARHKKRVHQGIRSHSCKECDRSFFEASELQVHMRRHSGERPYTCDECDKSYKSFANLKKHKMCEHHSLFECDLCGSIFTCKKKLKHHLQRHMNHMDTDDRYSCDLCRKSFADLGDMKKHKLSQHPGLFKCNLCDRKFISETKLKYHLYKHTRERPYSCDLCDKSFASSTILCKHKKYVHEKIREYFCQVCDRSFNYSSNLKDHLRTHTGERPFACDQCDKSYVSLPGLKRHKMTEHQSLFECDLCGRTFICKTKLERHLHKHADERRYSCNLCQESFGFLRELKKHKSFVHQGIRTHICKVCDRGFNDSRNLKVHLRIHTGERPFSCGRCNKSFTQKGVLVRHEKRFNH